jgi:hypothetical protein
MELFSIGMGNERGEMTTDDIIKLAGHRQVPQWVIKLVADAIEQHISKQALEQPEPVAWIVEDSSGEKLEWNLDLQDGFVIGTPKFPLYTTPPKREWQGLTDEEMLTIEETTTCTKDESWLRNLTRNIETKLKEKNT